MHVRVQNIKPKYMSELEVSGSDIYLQNEIIFQKGKKYLLKANSGHGKSSILNFIYDCNKNYTGKIIFEGNEDDSIISVRRKKLSYVFQDFKLFPKLTLWENIKIKNNLTNFKTDDHILMIIDKLGLSEKKDQLVETLSLGQKQRVSIIRSLCQPFDFLLLDEPFSHLDERNIEILTTIIDKELEDQNAGFIMTTLNNEYLFKYDKILNL
ncbi:MAG: ATP-binding cassette domain-containing protein [Flavobacteriales bacterium]|jgi:putative ABC transport system ATP-binding protein|nr:ATP-binding cassette domain-containing protein [Flavobacteriales bacterium]